MEGICGGKSLSRLRQDLASPDLQGAWTFCETSLLVRHANRHRGMRVGQST
jgi:hypothetical protein